MPDDNVLQQKHELLILYGKYTDQLFLALQNADFPQINKLQEEKNGIIIELERLDRLLSDMDIDQSSLQNLLQELVEKENKYQQNIAVEKSKLKDYSTSLEKNIGAIKHYLKT
ncbi:MAG: hypothetical protein HQK84_04910 [Nitrospinae bacterium]|nr:hypothetical protein [Nitrospinota bacterium]